MQYHRHNRRKYLLLFHLIFVVKYRKKIRRGEIESSLKIAIKELESLSDFEISEMEVDQDHLHMMIDLSPNYSISQLVRRLKQQTTKQLWEKHRSYLQRQFWLE